MQQTDSSRREEPTALNKSQPMSVLAHKLAATCDQQLISSVVFDVCGSLVLSLVRLHVDLDAHSCRYGDHATKSPRGPHSQQQRNGLLATRWKQWSNISQRYLVSSEATLTRFRRQHRDACTATGLTVCFGSCAVPWTVLFLSLLLSSVPCVCSGVTSSSLTIMSS